MAWNVNKIAVLIFILIGASIGISAGITLSVWFVERNPPVQILDSYFVNKTIEEGGDIDLYVHVTNLTNRTCPGDITREYITDFVFSSTGQKMIGVNGKPVPRILRDDAPKPIYDAGRLEYIVTFPATIKGSPIPPGKWKFRGETSYYCGWFAKSSYIAEIDNLTIVPKGTLPAR